MEPGGLREEGGIDEELRRRSGEGLQHRGFVGMSGGSRDTVVSGRVGTGSVLLSVCGRDHDTPSTGWSVVESVRSCGPNGRFLCPSFSGLTRSWNCLSRSWCSCRW